MTGGTTGWVVPERGGALAARLALFVALRLGGPCASALLWPATAYFLLTGGAARRASRDYLHRATGRRPDWRDVARHFHRFARATLDRALLLGGGADRFRIAASGLRALQDATDGGRGAILLGAHLGSFEALRALGRDCPRPVRPLMFRRNLGAPARLLERLDPALAARVIDIGDPDAMLRVRDSLRRGELVAMLADRAPRGERCVNVPFLGASASFPAGPFIVAALTEAPVVLCHAVRTGPRRYAVGFAPLADRVLIRRAHRAEDLRGWVQRYAAWLEALCRAHPFDWFNFYPFWEAA